MILKQSTQYKKDLKRYQNKPSKIAALKEVLKHLKKSGSVPAEYKPHTLSGKLKGFLECHVEDENERDIRELDKQSQGFIQSLFNLV